LEFVMHRTTAKLAGFAVGLVVIGGTAAAVGAAVGPSPERADEPAAMDEHGAMSTVDRVRGLSLSQDGLRLVLDQRTLPADRSAPLTFRVVDERGATVRDFDVEHTKRMHLILARRDLSGFQHLHPTQRADGRWTTRVRIADPGAYRVFADFAHDETPVTLGADLAVDGQATVRPLPAPAPTTTSDGGDRVQLQATDAHPGEEATLRFTVTRDGRPVELQPYLGAGGHLVALRDGDLAFLHVHPVETNGDRIAFAATFPTAGRYRLFLQYRVDGRVHTSEFTQEVGR
jgi:hypothetical protein